MTHFRCAVFSYDPNMFDTLLAPYDENNTSEYVFVKSKRTEDQLKQDYAKSKENGFEDSFSAWLEDMGYVIENGEYGYYANPSAQWDWYTLGGGAWQFDLKSGEKLDENGNGKKNQYSYLNNVFDAKEYTDRYNEYCRIVDEHDTSDLYFFDVSSEMVSEYPTLEDYLDRCRWEMPYAFITPDGVWHSAGTVGWFGSSDDTAESRKAYFEEWKNWIKDPLNPYVNFVDCHI